MGGARGGDAGMAGMSGMWEFGSGREVRVIVGGEGRGERSLAERGQSGESVIGEREIVRPHCFLGSTSSQD